MIKDRKIEEKQSTRAVRAAMWAAVNTLIPMLTSFGVLVVTSRMLRPSDFGVVALATGVALLGSVLCPGGFGEAIVQRLELSPKHLNTVFWLCMASGCIVYALECEFAGFAARFFKIHAIDVLVPVISLKLIMDMAAVVPNALIARSMSFYLFALRSLVASLIGASFTITLLLGGYGFWALVVSQLITSFVNATAGFLSSGWRPQLSFSFTALKEISGYGAYSSATSNISSLVAQNEQILVGYFLGTTQLGLYNFSKRVIAVLNSVIAGSLGAVAHPMFSGMQNDRERVRRGFLSATFVSSAISFPIFIGLAITSDRIVPLVFGSHWLNAVIFVRLQCALGLLACVGSLQAGLINSQGKANWWFYYQLLANLLTITVIAIFAQFGVKTMMIALVLRAYIFWFIPVKMTLTLLSMKMAEYFRNYKGPAIGSVSMIFAIILDRLLFTRAGNISGFATDVLFGEIAYLAGIFLTDRAKVLFTLKLFLPKSRSIRQLFP